MAHMDGPQQQTLTRIRMVAQPASVPAARRFVDDALTDWGLETLIDDVGLCVTELSTNATLHSGTRFFEIELEEISDAVRVAVVDTGRAPSASLESPLMLTDRPDTMDPDQAATTGRGLGIVSALATTWGIDEIPAGKRVWAEFTQGDESYDVQPPPLITRSDTHQHEPLGMPQDWVVVCLKDCPVALALAHDDNLADMIRELQLIGSDRDNQPTGRLAELLAGLVQRHAVTWDAGRLIARGAVQTGQEFADIEVAAPVGVKEDMLAMREALREADALSEEGVLMILPAPDDVQGVRDWMAEEFVAQTEQGRAPVSYRKWLAETQM